MKMIRRNDIVAVKSTVRCFINVRVEEGAVVVTLPSDRTDYVVESGDELTVRSRGTTAVSPLSKEVVVEVRARRLHARETIRLPAAPPTTVPAPTLVHR